jgi:hypothetical protein
LLVRRCEAEAEKQATEVEKLKAVVDRQEALLAKLKLSSGSEPAVPDLPTS